MADVEISIVGHRERIKPLSVILCHAGSHNCLLIIKDLLT